MTHNPSRKRFFGKLFGSATALLVSPKLFSKTGSESTAREGAGPVVKHLTVRADARVVARREGVV